ncbi:MAG: hypothetical protein ACREHC_05760 [Candidatus Levyibacteriota bacterium]
MIEHDRGENISSLPDGISFPPGVSLDAKANRRFTEAQRSGVDTNVIRGVVFALGEVARKPDGGEVVITTRKQSFYFDVLNRAARQSTRREPETDIFSIVTLPSATGRP